MPSVTSGQICSRHQQPYSALNPCEGCIADPRPVVTEQTPTTDEFTIELERRCEEHYQECAADAAAMRRHRREQRDFDHMGANCLAKQDEVMQKWLRLLCEVREPRLKREHERAMGKVAKKLKGIN